MQLGAWPPTKKNLNRAAILKRPPYAPKFSGIRHTTANPEEIMLQQPADPVLQPCGVGHNGGPPFDPYWGRARDASRHYKVGITKIYDWINAERFITRKVDGVRLLLIGAARGIDTDEDPPPDAVPVSRRPENAGRAWRGRMRQASADAFVARQISDDAA